VFDVGTGAEEAHGANGELLLAEFDVAAAGVEVAALGRP
jgi:hypothetical protein